MDRVVSQLLTEIDGLGTQTQSELLFFSFLSFIDNFSFFFPLLNIFIPPLL